ncbi:hypothetical protein [Actinoplanes sp. NPDC051494]|uniref:hypothetical protein n=1 Tax=Actinoplanes sp. NPDC051494 TaxID=3363907 RepID=UPI0037A1B54E
MSAPTTGVLCQLHTADSDVHPVDLLEGWQLDDGVIIPAALRCARDRGPEQDWRRVPADRINAGAVRS